MSDSKEEILRAKINAFVGRNVYGGSQTITRETGVPYHTIRRFRDGKRITIDSFIALEKFFNNTSKTRLLTDIDTQSNKQTRREHIAAREEQLPYVLPVITCRNCGEDTPAFFAKKRLIFCGHCGETLGSECTACGTLNEYDSKFCNSCGERLKAAP